MLRLYEGSANAVVAMSASGERVRFPLDSLRRFVTPDGVQGTFRLRVDDTNKLQGIDRVG